jgi:hypothetical protein
VQVVEIGDPAAIGALVLDLAGGAVDAQPGVGAGCRQREIHLFRRPFAGSSAQVDAQLRIQPVLHARRQRRLAFPALAQCREHLRRQRGVLLYDDGLGFDRTRMVQRDAGDREQQHRRQRRSGADPVPLVQGAQPEAATLLRGGDIAGGRWIHVSAHCRSRL